MPWFCCNRTRLDSAPTCPACGLSKAKWTVRLSQTRSFVVATSGSIQVSLRDDEGQVRAGEPYEVRLQTGEVKTGALDEEGYKEISGLPRRETVGLRFPNIDQRDWLLEAFDVDAAAVEDAADARPGWVELSLVDDEGPVPGATFELTLPDGSVRTGELDARGFARVDGLPPDAEVTLRFTAVDLGEWPGPAAAREVRAPGPQPEPEPAWVDIQVSDEEGVPLAGARFVLVLADGSEREGELDDRGRIDLYDLPAGRCQLRLVDVDRTEWVTNDEPPR